MDLHKECLLKSKEEYLMYSVIHVGNICHSLRIKIRNQLKSQTLEINIIFGVATETFRISHIF